MNTFISMNTMFRSKTINSTGFTIVNSFSTFTISNGLILIDLVLMELSVLVASSKAAKKPG